MRLAFEMSVATRGLLRARLVREHPAWPPERVEREIVRCLIPALTPPAARP